MCSPLYTRHCQQRGLCKYSSEHVILGCKNLWKLYCLNFKLFSISLKRLHRNLSQMPFATSYLIFYSHLIRHLQDSLSSFSIMWICHKCPRLCSFARIAFLSELPISSFQESAQVTALLKIFSQILKTEFYSIFFYFHSSLFMLLLLTYSTFSLWLDVSSSVSYFKW